MPKIFTSESQKTGELGENIACKYLENKGFKIIERNFTRKWGEIDIVAQKKKLHLIEVKSVSNPEGLGYRPEENLTYSKQLKLKRTLQTYLNARSVSPETVWQFDLMLIYINKEAKRAKVKVLANIIL